MKPFRYADYESRLMDESYIRMLQRPRVRFFERCRSVLDLACGPGIFLELLKEAGITARGVDRDGTILEKARRKGLDVVHSDVFEYLEDGEEGFDGLFCSHFLEHLAFDRVVRLIELVSRRLPPAGVAAFVLPNPGSIRLHLYGFWRDPEHVRFYSGSLIGSVCEHLGLRVEYCNEEEMPHALDVPRIEPFVSVSPDLKRKRFFSKKPDGTELLVHEFNRRIEEFNTKMEKFSEAINKVWSRDDEVVLVCRKEGGDPL